MSVGELCNREVVVIEPDATIAEAVRLMLEYNVGDVVAVEPHNAQRAPVGMLTDRDIVIKVMDTKVAIRRLRPFETS